MAETQRSLIRLRPRPDTVHVTQARTALLTDKDGFIYPDSEHGLFFLETRLLSEYRYLINGEQPKRVLMSNVRQHTWMSYYIASRPGAKGDEADPAQYSIELRLSRYIGDGMHEDVDITNWTGRPVKFMLALAVDADFADQEEVHAHQRKQRGKLTRRWLKPDAKTWELTFDYRVSHRYSHQGERGVAHLWRGCAVQIQKSQSPPRFRNGQIQFQISLAPKECWHTCVVTTPILDGKPQRSVYGCYSFFEADNDWERRRKIFLTESTDFSTPDEETLSSVVVGALEQSKRDLANLRMYALDHDDRTWITAAGVPTYLAYFGRDTLVAAWQAGILGRGMTRGALLEAARRQGTEVNDWRDEEPGRMVHEMHSGPLAMLNFNPRARYFGAVTPSIYFATVVAALYHWTGDKHEVMPFIEPALRGLRWADQYLDADGDGFYAYSTRSEQGLKNQGWKDSGDAIVYEDGRQVPNPIATCEEQAFVYVSKLHFSGVLYWLGRKDEARKMFDEASELKKRFNEKFWMEDEGFFAMALDSKKRQVKSVGSDPGHCLASGVVDHALVARAVERFTQPDLFSGWGIRTLSSEHPAFNPFSYHRGTVWPVENGTFSLAFVRYGLHDKVEMLCRAMFEVASLFDYYRLPEVFSGHQRDAAHPFPAVYPRADWPQAWSASCVFNLLQSMLGLFPYAPLKTLIVNPKLPAWLPEITINNLQLGRARLSIRFFREKSGSSDYEILDKRGTVHVIQQPSPWSLTEGWAERVWDAIRSLVPGK